MPSSLELFASCPKGIEGLLADELRTLGAAQVKETRAGVHFAGTLAAAYRVCLWSRLASRVLLVLRRFAAPTPEALYEGARTVDWEEHLAPDGTLAVDLTTVDSAITHAGYGALKVKDAVVDQIRDRRGVRPSVDAVRPDVRVNVHLRHDEAALALDLSGESLHRRGYRREGLEAPLRENLAAAILVRAGWPEIARSGGGLVDPMCGSGTLLVEGALMAADAAPGLTRASFGLLRGRGHDAAAWRELIAEARARREAGLRSLPPIRGYDRDAQAVRAARDNAARAGLAGRIAVARRELSACEPEADVRPGLVVTNPPYGERLGEAAELPALHAELGARLRECFVGWRAAVFTARPDFGKRMGLRARRTHRLFNGALECRLLRFDVAPEWFVRGRAPAAGTAPGPGAGMFANRLRKDLRHFGRWAKRRDVACYRVYDADVPEYNLAVDVYEAERRYVHVQEYEAPASVDARDARRRLEEALATIVEVFGVGSEQVFLKVRRRQRGGAQYERLGASGDFHEVREGPCRFLVEFRDHLDTGLFLDHRDTRALIGGLAPGRRFLNLFGYTGTATVHAALGGATATTTVDLSRTYLDWARRNLERNGLRGRGHELVAADVPAWLARARRRYGLILLDPPTFSRSKRMTGTLDVQRDHVALVRAAAALLEPDGCLIFSTNLRSFELDRAALADLDVEDITGRTIPPDFARNPRIHRCFRITRA